MKTNHVNTVLIIMIIVWCAYTSLMYYVASIARAARPEAIANGIYEPMSIIWVIVWMLLIVIMLVYGIIAERNYR